MGIKKIIARLKPIPWDPPSPRLGLQAGPRHSQFWSLLGPSTALSGGSLIPPNATPTGTPWRWWGGGVANSTPSLAGSKYSGKFSSGATLRTLSLSIPGRVVAGGNGGLTQLPGSAAALTLPPWGGQDPPPPILIPTGFPSVGK